MHTHRPLVVLLAALTLGGCAMAAASPTDPGLPSPTALPLVGAPSAAFAPPATEPVGVAARTAVAAAIARLESDPADPAALLDLGFAAYQLARETADPAELVRAEEALANVLAIDPLSADALIGLGTIALARHDFADALAFGERARDLAPRAARAWGVIADAFVELGQYPEAVDAVQTMVDLRPDLGSYARVSYLRELHGQLDGAIEAMEAAVQAGGGAVENTEYLRVILGNLWFLAGDLDRARAAYAASLERSPGYVFALAGMARVDAAQGDLAAAVSGWQTAADRVPLPELLIGLGESQEAAGLLTEAAATYQLVRDIQGFFAANGVQTDLELALFEADHGEPERAVELARAAWAATPNVKAADALGWALYAAGELDEARSMAEEALRLGSLEPSYRYHAGMIAAAQGDDAAARRWLRDSLEPNARWSPFHAPRAAAALEALGDGPVATPSSTEVAR